MENQGPIRIGVILASTLPSLFCFGASAYLLSHHIDKGWGWLMLIGLIGFELPKTAIKTSRPRRNKLGVESHGKPEPIYDEEFV
jgi:hypothetical protein